MAVRTCFYSLGYGGSIRASPFYRSVMMNSFFSASRWAFLLSRVSLVMGAISFGYGYGLNGDISFISSGGGLGLGGGVRSYL